MKVSGLWWKSRFIDESGEKCEMTWFSNIESIRDYFKYQRPKCKNVKIDSIKNP